MINKQFTWVCFNFLLHNLFQDLSRFLFLTKNIIALFCDEYLWLITEKSCFKKKDHSNPNKSVVKFLKKYGKSIDDSAKASEMRL